MGIAISGYSLARAVARAGQLGVVSGTAIDTVFARRLQNEGVSEALRSVLERFPRRDVVDWAVDRFATPGARRRSAYRTVVMPTHRSSSRANDLLVLAAYAEVAMAKDGHDGLVGVNLLTKVQLPTAPTLLGAILAGVDYVTMGAGIPTHIPGVLAQLARGEEVRTPLDVTDDADRPVHSLHFDPTPYLGSAALTTPRFLGVVSSHVLASALVKRSNGPVDGFVLERPSAGGHNAPPRGPLHCDATGQPEYGERDRVDYQVLRDLARPFWIGGGVTAPRHVDEAFELGATGVQVGTLFAYCAESGMDPTLRARVLGAVARGDVRVTTSLRASSTGYPFKVVTVADSLSEPEVYDERSRECDLGYLREAYRRRDGSIGYRCAAEPVAAYVRKGGRREDTVGVTCLCNGLLATCGLGQIRPDGREPPIVTSGDALGDIRALIKSDDGYSAADVIASLAATPRSLGPGSQTRVAT